ncbi:B3 domain-containing protein Os01g0234100-like [Herrania umbratica]|uniref:B3 domain-containing protein Os01g0234100-like n=1 Tax=Herrania umbratica TaxID=108875 RepID=A0A6J1BD20_9ROSI|nr:B3 domain-containing protein Os01g0234100-like [Herrania umbratica]
MAVSPKQRISPVKAKRRRPPKIKFFRKKLSGLDKRTPNQFVSLGKEKAQRHKRKRVDDMYENDEVKSALMERAVEVQANLSSEFPSLIKYMLPSHVTGGFWLGLPKDFCLKHLPKEDRMIVLEDEEGIEFQAKYLAEKTGLSGGWRRFSIAHKLLEGDVCVFHLIKTSKLKVYIVRSKGSDEVNVALGLLKLESSTEPMDLVKEPKFCEGIRDESLGNYGVEENRICVETTGKSLEVLPLGIYPKTIHNNDPTLSSTNLGPTPYHSENDSEDLGSEVLDGIRLSESIVEFKEVKSIENFKILANGLIINSELAKYVQMKYYELCCSQKSFLHDHLLGGLNYKLVAGVIAETVNIADAIRAAKLTTSHHNFLTWDQTLKSFEGLGMKVGMLRSRLDQLMNLSLKAKRYQEARLEQVHAKEEKRKLEAKLLEVTEALNRLDIEIGSLEEENADRLELLFQEKASAPW